MRRKRKTVAAVEAPRRLVATARHRAASGAQSSAGGAPRSAGATAAGRTTRRTGTPRGSRARLQAQPPGVPTTSGSRSRRRSRDDERGPEAESPQGLPHEELVAAPEGDEAAESPPEVAEAPAADPPDEPTNFLALYFREMASLSVLRPEEELEAAKRLEGLERELWGRLMHLTPVVDHLLKVVEVVAQESPREFRAARRALGEARRQSSAKSQAKVRRAVDKAVLRIQKLDIDKRLLEAAVTEVHKIHRRDEDRLVGDRLCFSPATKRFRHYHQDVVVAEGRMRRAKNAFVKANLRLVVSIARRFNHGRMPLADLIQEGNIGLIKAVERFDYHRGYRFSTYASWWIRHAISRALADKGRAVRLPVHMIDAYHRVARSKRELSGKLGRQPSSDEIAADTGIAVTKIEKMRTYLLDQSFSLDRTISNDDGRTFIEFVTDPNPDKAPSERLIDEAMTGEVRRILSQLRPIEADIIRQRFGLDTDEERTLKEIGEKYDLSRERIRQLQEQALDKMRRALQRKDLM